MTIEEYKKEHPDFDIRNYYTLDFVDPEDGYEEILNIEYVLTNYPTFNILSIVIRSYNSGIILW